MDRNYEACIDFVLDREGGYVDDPADPGGATNLGITIAVLAAWRGKKVTKDDVQRLTRHEAEQIYRRNYWHAALCEHLPDGVDLLVFDAAVNMGIAPALNLLRAQTGLPLPIRTKSHARFHPVGHHAGHRATRHPTDPHIGAALEAHLLAAMRGMCVPAVLQGVAQRRRRFYHSLKSFSRFGKGWLARVELVQHLAMRLWVTHGTGIPAAVGPIIHHRRRKAAAP